MKEVTLDNITKEDIIVMAKTIQQYEQLVKDQQGYILQLQTQLRQRTGQLANAKSKIVPLSNQGFTNFLEVEGKLDL